MANDAAQNASQGREDVSRFVVHLTRDDRKDFTNGAEARENFISILKSKIIHASKAHCLYNEKLAQLPETTQDAFKVACFTEVPLSQIHLLTLPIKGRRIKLEAYGLVFKREFIIENGGQPAIYVNSYGRSTHLRECVDALFKQSMASQNFSDPVWRLFPFINAMHERYDFSWEREWRCCGHVKFSHSDLVCLIVPDGGDPKVQEASAKAGLAVISPGWTYEQIIAELATQQRATRKLALQGNVIEQKEPKK